MNRSIGCLVSRTLIDLLSAIGVAAVVGMSINVFDVRICVFGVAICESNTLFLLWKTSCHWWGRQSVGFNVIRAFDAMENWQEFFTEHSLGHDSVGGDGVLCEIDVIGADINPSAP